MNFRRAVFTLTPNSRWDRVGQESHTTYKLLTRAAPGAVVSPA